MGDVVRVVLVVHGAPAAQALIGLHRALGLGLAEVRGLIRAGRPILDAELFGNDHDDVARVVEAVLGHLTDVGYAIHECIDGDAPSPSNEITVEMLRGILAGHRHAAPGSPPAHPDAGLTEVIADAARKADRAVALADVGPLLRLRPPHLG